jgi:cyanophycinase
MVAFAGLAAGAACGGLAGAGGAAERPLTRYLTGSAADVAPPLAGPAHVLQGGGGDVDAALQWLIDEVRGCAACATTLDIVVLRASGADAYNEYLHAMNGVDSVETLVITTPDPSSAAPVVATVRAAEIVFFAGGDQCKYVRNFKGTPLAEAVEAVYARGGGVGGNSAGLAILGEYVYDACTGSETSARALADPYDEWISFTYGFFRWPHLERTITDTHVDGRDRLGRTLAFLARQIRDGVTPRALAIAVSEATSVVVDAAGRATVMGAGPAYFILADHPPEVCEPGRPLTYRDYKIWRVPDGGSFDLADRPASGFYLRSVVDGVLPESPYLPD